MSLTTTFDELEDKFENTEWWVLAATDTNTSNWLKVFLVTSLLALSLKRWASFVTYENLSTLQPETAVRVTNRLLEAHGLLLQFLHKPEINQLSNRVIIGRIIRSIGEKTEDLSDVVEYLLLADNLVQ